MDEKAREITDLIKKTADIERVQKVIPLEVYQAVFKFVVDKKSGNVIISIKEGRIASMKTEMFTRL